MKRRICIHFFSAVMLLIFCTNLRGQTIRELDNKRGYLDFKLGDSYGKWANSLIYSRTEGSGTVYKYTGYLSYLFNTYPVYEIDLTFSNNKLVSIYILLHKFQTNDPSDNRKEILENCSQAFGDIGSRFKLLFGGITKSVEPKKEYVDDDLLWKSKGIWIASNTSLILSLNFMEFKAVCAIDVEIVDNQYYLKENTSGF